MEPMTHRVEEKNSNTQPWLYICNANDFCLCFYVKKDRLNIKH